jgi:formylglycine-generating enzyme required for sulfatase activity
VLVDQAPYLDLAGLEPGTWLLRESDDLRVWTPRYAFSQSGVAGRLLLPLEADHKFHTLAAIDYPALQNFAWIPPGEFLMGSPEAEPERDGDEGPQRVVRLSRGFWMSHHEVTAREFVQFMGMNPSAAPDDSTRPIENVSADEAMEYCRRRTSHDWSRGSIPPATYYRLPSEAEWEYACRAGTQTPYSFGTGTRREECEPFAWSGLNSGGTTHPVGEKLPNPWGLRDMHGNVFEWCLDYYGAYPGGVADSATRFHAYRGGSYYCPLRELRAASRHAAGEERAQYIGFRVVLGGEPDTLLSPPVIH